MTDFLAVGSRENRYLVAIGLSQSLVAIHIHDVEGVVIGNRSGAKLPLHILAKGAAATIVQCQPVAQSCGTFNARNMGPLRRITSTGTDFPSVSFSTSVLNCLLFSTALLFSLVITSPR